MRAFIFIDGRFVGSVDYELPKDEHGREIAVPSREYPSEVGVLIRGPEDKAWFACGKARTF